MLLALLGGALLLAAALRLLNPLPPLQPRVKTCALTDTKDTRLGRVMTPLVVCHPGLTGLYLLDDSREAFAARLLLVPLAGLEPARISPLDFESSASTISPQGPSVGR